MDGDRHCHDGSKQASLPPSPLQYLSYQELSARTGISISTLRRRVKQRRLPHFQPGGPRTRIVFPSNAIELCNQPDAGNEAAPPPPPPAPSRGRRGPAPKWLNR
jgi:excisionase family DNA binding protein